MTTTTDSDIALDDADRAVILAVHRARRATGSGPTWNELRQAVPDLPPRPDVSMAAFGQWWSDPANREAIEASHLERFWAQHPDRGDGAWVRYAFKVWRWRRLAADPLAHRLRRLRSAGYLHFTQRERSLDIGRRVRAGLRRSVLGRGSTRRLSA